MSALEAPAARDEARRELTGIISGGPFSAIPTELLVEHVLASYPDASWPILREAAKALLRRAEAGEREGLRVAAHPPRKAWYGSYRTRRAGDSQRPYQTRVISLRPLRVSCDCPDYQKGGLGLCKHGLVVLADLASRPRVWARAVDAGMNGHGPRIYWNPIRPLEGTADWLGAVRIRDEIAGKHRLRPQLASSGTAEEGWLIVPPKQVRSVKARKKVVDKLAQITAKGRDRDPAVRALLRHEREQAERCASLQVAPTKLRAILGKLRLRLYPYQRHAVERFLGSGRMLLADDMGLGKTVQAAAIAHVLAEAGIARRVLVLAPASLKSQWVREWRRVTELPIDSIDGPPDTRRATYRAVKTGALVANYEQTFRDLETMQKWAPDLVILDEAQRIKNWATLTARRVKQLDVPYRLVLTGTPLENRLDELASIMDWVEPFAVAPKWRLAPAHLVSVDGSREVVGVRRLDVLRKRLEPVMVRRRRAEILADLPERTDTTRAVAMTQAQKLEHDELSQPIARLVQQAQRRPLSQPEFLRLMSLLNTQRVIANGLAQLNFVPTWPTLQNRPPDEATLTSLSMPKLEHLRELVESIVIDQGRKIIVFSQWRRALSLAGWAIGDLLRSAGLRAAFFTGQESQKRRTQNVVDFHDDPSLRVLLCTDAGGVGLNLQRAASACVHFELPWNPAVFEQRVGRIHRLGQPEPVDVYTLMSDDSIEARIASTLSDKRALFTGLFDGDSDEIQFEGSAGFLEAVKAVVDPSTPVANEESSDPDDLDDPDEDASTRVEQAVAAADERSDSRPSLVPPASPSALPHAAEVRSLFAELRVDPRPDGSLHLQASPRAAKTLSALFAGMASLLEQADQQDEAP